MALFAVAGLVVNVVGNLILLPRYRYIAAAWITLVTEIVVIVPSATTAFRGMRMPLRLGRLPRISVAAAVMGIVVWLLSTAGVGVSIAGLVGVPVYALTLYLVRALMPDERASSRHGCGAAHARARRLRSTLSSILGRSSNLCSRCVDPIVGGLSPGR